MKKILALLLVLCMVFGLVACKKPADKTDGTNNTGAANAGNSANNNNDSDEDEDFVYTYVKETAQYKEEELVTGTGAAAVNKEITDNNDLINPAFSGKKLQLYSYSSELYDDIDNMGQGSFIWMVRAAIADWAALNNVEIEYVGDYDQNVIMGDIKSGNNPDLILHCNKFPLPATTGLTRAFTDEEYEQLAKTCGSYYLDMCNYKGKSYGVVAPWSGGTLFYYNKTLFEQYGVKSPKEYFMEDNWNWDTMEKCLTEITKDLDGNGSVDIYGCGSMFRVNRPFTRKLADDGKAVSLVRNSAEYKRYLEILYKGVHETKSMGDYSTMVTSATNPRPATACQDAEWYNFAHLNQTLVNGDVIEVVPMPKFTNDSESWYEHTIVYASVLSSCDENEAAVALLNYILRVGMRYMSDFSLGLYKCNYEGIRGASKFSAGWKSNFADVVEERQEKFDELEEWDQELYEKFQAAVLGADNHFISLTFPNETSTPVSLGKEEREMPPASAIPVIAQREEAWVNEYNNLYAN